MEPKAEKVSLLRVIDGDTVIVARGGGLFQKPKEDRIRLYGIDASESGQKGGSESTRYLQRLIGGWRTIWLTTVSTDQYGRTVGIIHSHGHRRAESYNRQMLAGGQAIVYMLEALDREEYRAAEREAREARRGVWKAARMETPREFRRRQEERAKGGFMFTIIKLALLAAAIAAAAYTVLYVL